MSNAKLDDSQAIIDDLMGFEDISQGKPTVCPDEPINVSIFLTAGLWIMR